MKQIDNLTNVIFVDDNNLRLDPLERKKLQQQNQSENDINQEDSRNERESEVIDNIDLNLLILQRSLFILKKKFEKYQKEISSVYNKNDPNKLKKVTVNKFMNMLKEIFDESKMSVAEIKKPSDVFKVDYIENLNPKSVEVITKKIYDFMIQDRSSYNQIIKSKKNIKDDVDEEVIMGKGNNTKDTSLDKNEASNNKERAKENKDQNKLNQAKNSSENSNITKDKETVKDNVNDKSNENKKSEEGGSESKLNQNKDINTIDGSKLNTNEKKLEESKNTKKNEKKEAEKKINENPKKEEQKELGKNNDKTAKNEESKEAKSKVDINVNKKEEKKDNQKDLTTEKPKNEEAIKKEGLKKEEKQENEKYVKNDIKNAKKEENKNDPSKENKKIEEFKDGKKGEIQDKSKTTEGLEIKKEGNN
jgi:hypothetical protein